MDAEGVGQVKPGSEPGSEDICDGDFEVVGKTGGAMYDDAGDELLAEGDETGDATEDANVEEGDGKYTSNEEPAVDAVDETGGNGTTG